MRRSNLVRSANPYRIASSQMLRFALRLLLAMTLGAGSVTAQTPSAKQTVLERIIAHPFGPNFAVVSAELRLNVDTARAYRQLDTLLARPYGDMFWVYGCAGLYYATQDVLRPSYKERIRWCWKHYTPYRGDTENHFLMYYGSLLLMSQEWPELADTEWFMGKSSKDIYAESKEYLDHWIDETVRYGMTEWSSPRYDYYYLTPLILLAEYTKDARMKHRFEMMVEYILADYAQEYLNGSYCGAHSRVSDECAIDPRKAEMTAYGDYFFRVEDTSRVVGADPGALGALSQRALPDSVLQPDVAFAALASFECPKIIRDIATDRSQPFESHSMKRGRQMIRYMNMWSSADSSYDSGYHAPVYKYDYMTKDYCLGSMQGGIVQPIQQQSWSLVFDSDKPHNIITGLHPYVNAEELGMFFPEYPSFMLERIGNVKKGYTNENKWEGGSPYEHIYQDKNVLVALYDLPDSVKWHHVDLFYPMSLQDIVHSNEPGIPWQFYTYDSTFVGIYLIGGNDRSDVCFPDSIGYHIRRTPVASGSKQDFGYLVYCDALRGRDRREVMNQLAGLHVIREAGHLRTLEDGGRAINISIRPPTQDAWLVRSPYLESKRGSGVLVIRYKNEIEVLNFDR